VAILRRQASFVLRAFSWCFFWAEVKVLTSYTSSLLSSLLPVLGVSNSTAGTTKATAMRIWTRGYRIEAWRCRGLHVSLKSHKGKPKARDGRLTLKIQTGQFVARWVDCHDSIHVDTRYSIIALDKIR
jgi:hypothetical protein